MGWDLVFIETGDGGDLTMKGNDFGVFNNDENEIYMRMFGGNVEGDTKINRRNSDQDNGYWANKLLFGDDPTVWFNSLTERTLGNTELSSKGLVTIENAIKKDLSGLKVTVTVQITGIDRVRVMIKDQDNKLVMVFTFVQNSPALRDFDLSDFSPIDFA